MARGIWKNGLFKIFLTRSFLGTLFRPVLYSIEESIHSTFLEQITPLTGGIVAITDLKKRGLAYYWLVEVPRTLFEELFITDEENQRKCNIIDFVTSQDGTEIAHITQGYVLANLESMIKTDSLFSAILGLTISDLEQVINSALGRENQIFHYQQYFRTLLAAHSDDLEHCTISRLYLEEIIRHLIEPDAAICTSTGQVELYREALPFCTWKLQNAKYSTIAMFHSLEKTGVTQASSENKSI